MSYLLEFPRRPFPDDIRSPPHVAFSINNEYVPSTDLPRVPIPWAMVQHFAPKTKEWISQPPTDIPQYAKYYLLRKPVIGINIPRKMPRSALATIIKRMLQLVGLTIHKEDFEMDPKSINDALRLRYAWAILELPMSGIQSLDAHLLCRLSLGDPVTLADIHLLWAAYPRPSLILDEMAQNFTRSYVNSEYTFDVRLSIISWVQEDRERRQLFSRFAELPDYNNTSSFPPEMVAKRSRKRSCAAHGESGRKKHNEILEKFRTLQVSTKERNDRQRKDREELERRLRRLRPMNSNESLRSVDTAIHIQSAPSASETASLESAVEKKDEAKEPSIDYEELTKNLDLTIPESSKSVETQIEISSMLKAARLDSPAESKVEANGEIRMPPTATKSFTERGREWIFPKPILDSGGIISVETESGTTFRPSSRSRQKAAKLDSQFDAQDQTVEEPFETVRHGIRNTQNGKWTIREHKVGGNGKEAIRDQPLHSIDPRNFEWKLPVPQARGQLGTEDAKNGEAGEEPDATTNANDYGGGDSSSRVPQSGGSSETYDGIERIQEFQGNSEKCGRRFTHNDFVQIFGA